MGSEVGVEVIDGVGVVTLAAPARRNALTVSMAMELAAACDRLDADRSVGAVVVRGSEGFFCSGAHRDILAATAQDPAATDVYESISAVYRAFVRVSELGVPSIAALRGGCVGAGLNLLLACSLRIVARDASIVPGFARIGLHPGGGHLALLHRVAGWEATAALALFGETLTGERAAALGLAWAAVPDDEVEPRALELARVAAKDPELARLVVRSLRNEVGPPAVSLAAALDIERAAQMRSQRRVGERAG